MGFPGKTCRASAFEKWAEGLEESPGPNAGNAFFAGWAAAMDSVMRAAEIEANMTRGEQVARHAFIAAELERAQEAEPNGQG